jgi:hypothetical protein
VALTARRFLIGLALAWLIPLCTHAVGLDAILPVLIVAALVLVLRGATTLLDRVVVALGQLFGALCVGGLLISWWPWGLNPVLIAGGALTVLLVLSRRRGPGVLGLSRRRGVSLPRLGGRRDALVVVTWLAVTALAAVPFVVRDRAGRLGIMATGEDLTRHYGLYDAIRHVNGYAFMHIEAAKSVVPDVGILTYPQGTHFLYALLGRFAGAGTDPIGALDWFIWCELGSFSFLALAVLWAVRRVAGPGVSWPSLLLVLAPVAAYLMSGDLLSVLMRDFPNELVGLGLVAILAALLARPLHRTGEQVLTVSALLVGLSFTYYLYLPAVGLVALAWAIARRRQLRWWLLTALVCLPLMVITPLSNPGANNGNVLLLKGTAFVVDRPVLLVLVAAAVVGVVARRGPASRTLGLFLALVLAADGILATYQLVAIGQTVYYFEKLLHLLVVVSVVSLGTVARLILPPPRPRACGASPTLIRPVPFLRYAVAGAAVCALLAGFGGTYHIKPGSYGLHLVLLVEKGSQDAGRDTVAIAEQYPTGPVVVDLMHSRYANYFATTCAAALRRDVPAGAPWTGLLWPSAPYRTYEDVATVVRAAHAPVRLLVSDPAVHSLAGPNGPSNTDIAQRLAGEYPDKILLSAPVR